jgi:hypothetical protein
MIYNLNSTASLIDILKGSTNLRRICGWETKNQIPHESSFSRAFEQFASTELPDRVHAALISKYEQPRLVGHISRDSTAIMAREKAAKQPKPEQILKRNKGRRGRPKKGEERPAPEPTRLERQASGMTLDEMLADLPKACDFSAKKNSQGKVEQWKGYKLHIDWADNEIPISCVLTSASVHDSQVAIPLMQMTNARVTNLYDLMDSAYDAPLIKAKSLSLGHVPIIDHNPRRGEKVEMDPATAKRYNERSTAERGNSMLKDNHSCRMIRVRGYSKVRAHLMFGILALTAEQLLRLVM